jgi:hypothetical protein
MTRAKNPTKFVRNNPAGLISRERIQRLALRDDVCCNCGDAATETIGGYLVCENARCQTVTRRIVKERERGKP